METIGSIAGYLFLAGLIIGAAILGYEVFFRRKPVIEDRGWKPEGRVLRRADRSIVYEGDPDDPEVGRRK